MQSPHRSTTHSKLCCVGTVLFGWKLSQPSEFALHKYAVPILRPGQIQREGRSEMQNIAKGATCNCITLLKKYRKSHNIGVVILLNLKAISYQA